MAVLSDSNRFDAWAEYMQENKEAIGITKQDLRAAINAADAWIDSNAASFNTAIPQPARNVLSAKQKAMLFMTVAIKRFGVA